MCDHVVDQYKDHDWQILYISKLLVMHMLISGADTWFFFADKVTVLLSKFYDRYIRNDLMFIKPIINTGFQLSFCHCITCYHWASHRQLIIKPSFPFFLAVFFFFFFCSCNLSESNGWIESRYTCEYSNDSYDLEIVLQGTIDYGDPNS